MKTLFLAVLLLLTIKIQAQNSRPFPEVFHDSILTTYPIAVGDTAVYGIKSDTSHFFDLSNRGGMMQYQVYITAISNSGVLDTMVVQQRVTYGRGANLDSAWMTLLVYNSYISETPDSLFVINRLPSGAASPAYSQALLWTPFLGDRIRLIRLSPHSGQTNRLYFSVLKRPWK